MEQAWRGKRGPVSDRVPNAPDSFTVPQGNANKHSSAQNLVFGVANAFFY